jgi:putative ABC transport system permease protein
MNPFPMLRAELKALRWLGPAIVLIVALAVMIGVALNAQERAFRKGSAKAAEDFDLVIGAPGSQSQLLLSSVFLQPEALPLMSGDILSRLANDRRVQAAAPLAAGDNASGYPIVGTSAAFATRWGRIQPSEGRVFAGDGEAIVGADVTFALGDRIIPSHTIAGISHHAGEAPDEEEHRHEGFDYRVVGRLPRLGTPWDRAIMVPIGSVWAVHGLKPEEGKQSGGAQAPGVPLIIVKPRGIADAYALRAAYRQGGTTAFFPAEVLVQLYQVVGDIRTVLVIASTLNAILIFSAVLVLVWAITVLRRRRYAILRALGAPRRFLFLVVWLNAATLLAMGCTLGLLLGWLATGAVANYVARETGLVLEFIFADTDLSLVLILILGGSTLALVPAALICRLPVAEGLRSG